MPLRWIGKHLMIKSKFAEDILNGRKRATIRLGKVEARSKEFYIHSGGRIIARARLKSIRYKKVRELTDEDAKIDGLSSRQELIDELRNYYGDISDDDTVTIIEFEILEKLNEPEEKYLPNLPPHKIAQLALENLKFPEKEEIILRTLATTKSIRKTAKKLFGKLSMRWKIRKVLRKALRKLLETGIIEENIGGIKIGKMKINAQKSLEN